MGYYLYWKSYMTPLAEYYVLNDEANDQVPRSEQSRQVKENLSGNIDARVGEERGYPFVSEILVDDAETLARLKAIASLVGSDLVKFISNPSGNMQLNGKSVRMLAIPLVNMRLK